MFPKLFSLRFRPAQYAVGGIGNWSGLLPVAADLIAELKPRVFVELGTHFGESYFGFCQAIQETRIHCSAHAIDTWTGDPQAGRYGRRVFEYVSTYNAAHYASFSTLMQMNFEDAVTQFEDGTIDLLHLDGCHTYDAVKHDFETWLPKVSSGGVILIHDIAVHQDDFGSWKLWEEISDLFPSFAFLHSCGLGVLAKSKSTQFDNPYLAALLGGAGDPEAIRDYYVLCAERLEAEHRARSTHFSVCQVFSPGASGYSEERSVSTNVPVGEWVDVDLDVPVPCGRLRLDPASGEVLAQIDEITVHSCSLGQILWRQNSLIDEVSYGGTAHRIPDTDKLIVFSDGDDPQIYLPLIEAPDPNDLLHLHFRIRLQDDTSVIGKHLKMYSQVLAEVDRLRASLGQLQAASRAWVEERATILKLLTGEPDRSNESRLTNT